MPRRKRHIDPTTLYSARVIRLGRNLYIPIPKQLDDGHWKPGDHAVLQADGGRITASRRKEATSLATTWTFSNRSDLEAAGYKYDLSAICSGPWGCRKLIEWWITPNGMWIGLDPRTLQLHRKTCDPTGRLRHDGTRRLV